MIVGAGAAGLMAAIHAATPAATAATSGHEAATAAAGGHAAATAAAGANAPPEVLVVESTRDGGRKILISGGGRCNVLPGELDESRFFTDSSPNTMKKILRSWPLAEQRRFFEEELGVALRLEAGSGKLFPASNRARDVRDALIEAARARGVTFRFETPILGIESANAPQNPGAGRADREQAPGSDEAPAAAPDRPVPPQWRLRTSAGETITASAVILATGGLSVPKTGSDGTGLLIARGLGHEFQPTYAALTPLVDEHGHFASLAGVSLDVTLEAPTARRPVRSHGGFLFTHRGYSGPAVLDVSHLAVRSIERGVLRGASSGPLRGRGHGHGHGLPSEASVTPAAPARPQPQKLFVQWTKLDRAAWEYELAPRRASVAAAVRAHLPARLADALVHAAGIPGQRSLAELRSDERRRLLDALTHFELPWTGHEGYRTAEVTGGGIALSEVDPRTMESRRCPGLFLCGEMLDAFGPIGGYNFLWAWATGRAAGLGARARIASADWLASPPRAFPAR